MTVTLELFKNEGEYERYRAGETLFREGDSADSMYVVLDGEVELRVNGKAFETLGPGGVLGEMALVDRAPRAASAVALTDCRLARVAEKRFLFMVRETPHFALQIMQLMAERLRRMIRRL
jgi:CRP/FNR family transcriptional regulator, cyclic AMP receptor protein